MSINAQGIMNFELLNFELTAVEETNTLYLCLFLFWLLLYWQLTLHASAGKEACSSGSHRVVAILCTKCFALIED